MHGDTPRVGPANCSPLIRRGRGADLHNACGEKAGTALGVLSMVQEIHSRLLLLSPEDFHKARNPQSAYDAVARVIAQGKRSSLRVLHYYLERTSESISDHEKLQLRESITASKTEQKAKQANKNRWRRVRRLSKMLAQAHAKGSNRGAARDAPRGEDVEAGGAPIHEYNTVAIGRAIRKFDAESIDGVGSGLCSIEENEEFDVIFSREGNEWCGIQRRNGERGYVPMSVVVLVGETTTEGREASAQVVAGKG